MSSRWGRVGAVLTGIRVWTVNLLTLAVLAYVLVVVVAVLRQMPETVDPDGRVLILNPSGAVVDHAVLATDFSVTSLRDREKQIQSRDLVRLIRAAADDERLTGVLLDFSKTSFSGPTTALTIAEELAALRESGKPVLAYSETLTTASYLMAAQAQEVYLHPGGALNITGLGGYRNYLREMLEKLKVTVHNYAQGDYKSAVERLTRDSMSAADREQTEQYLGPIWAAMKAAMAEARGVEPAVVQELADSYPAIVMQAAYDNLRFAEQRGLIDGTMSYAEFRSLMMDRFGVDEESERDTYPHIVADAYAAQLKQEDDAAEDSVSVVFVEGTIQEGDVEPGVAGAADIGRLMREAYEDDSTRAIVLRVNSPGGGILASELIRDEVLEARRRDIPVVASMGDLAASGGMFVSAPANRILAEPTTITGSIGVAIAFPTFENSLDHVGIKTDGVATSEFAGWGVNRPVDERLDAVLSRFGSSSYNRFIYIVADGRQREESYIRTIAGGRVWTGERALEVGLVDAMGGLEDAIEAAAELAGIEDYRVDYRQLRPPFSMLLLQRFISDLGIEAASPFGAFGRRAVTLFEDLEALSRPSARFICTRCLVELQ